MHGAGAGSRVLHLMDETALRLGIDDLCAAYADCIDDDRLEEWPDFFVENCRYLITNRESHAEGLRHGIIYCASRGMLQDRVMALRRANIFEAHRYRHITGPVRIDRVEGGVAEVRSNFLAVLSCTTATASFLPPVAISTALM